MSEKTRKERTSKFPVYRNEYALTVQMDCQGFLNAYYLI